MAYEEYDYYNEPAGDSKSLKESLREILYGLQDRTKLREAGTSLKEALQLTPNVTESLARGGVGQAIGTSGDLREIRNTINSYLPKSVRNFTQAAEFLANPYATAIQQTAPTTEKVLEAVPRATDKYEGYRQHETLGEFVAPSLGYFGAKAIKAGKDMPAGLSIMGPESKLWNKEMAFNAGKLEAKGATPDEILEKTGMVRGLDNQWRSELSDQFARMKEGENFGEIQRRAGLDGVWAKDQVLVKDVLEHPELFEAYSHLGDIQVKTHSKDIPARGSYNQKRNEISLREDLTPDEAKSVMLHELTHGIQAEEGFNRGANAAELVRAYEQKQQALLPRIAELSDQMREANMAGDMEKYRQIMAERDALSQEFTKMNPEEMGYEDYFRHGGEAEARMVQKRMDLSPEELRKNFPYQYTGETGKGLDINPDEAIITTKQPGTINMPEQSVEPPRSKADQLGFNSALETAALGIKQPKGTGEQFLKQLEKTPGVKTEELEATGLKQYLQDHKFVTKQEVQDFLENNRLRLENKILDEGTGQGNTYEEYQLQGGDVYHDDDYIRGLADDLHYDMKNDDVIRSQEREALLEADPERYADYETNPYSQAKLEEDIDGVLYENAKQQANDMYYENPIRHYYDEHGYDIYGNDDMGYSVKDPQGRFLDIGGRNGLYDLGDAENALRSHLLDEGILGLDDEGAAKYADYVLPGRHENYREVLITHDPKPAIVEDIGGGFWAAKDSPDAEAGIGKSREEAINNWKYSSSRRQYESSHFDEPNILAHMRVNDRTINGKKTLMVEEIQSDWHQAGRKKGYDTLEARQNIKKERQKLLDEKDHFEELAKPYTDLGQDAPPDIVDGWTKAANGLQELQKIENSMRSAVPNAPFKKNWHEMVVKQALDMAAKGDYEAIAFTTGKQQAARYNLSKQIDALDLIPAKEGDKQFVLQAWKDGRNVVRKAINEDELADYVGKEVAEKLLAQEPKGLHRPEGIAHGNPNVFEGRELTGLDLETGGEGMKGFYDKIIPDYINKYGKKWGMGMKKANLGTDRFRQDLSDEELAKGLEHFGLDTNKFYQMGINERSDTYEKISRELYPMKNNDDVHFIELSDAAKKDIKEKGQPLFAGLGLGLGTDYMMEPDDQMKTGIFKDLAKSKK